MLALSAVASLGIVACGNDNKDSGSAAQSTQAAPAPAATTDTSTSASAGGTALKVAADPGGKLAFDKKTLQASAGKVTIDFTNQAQIPHNVSIEKGEQDVGATDTITASQTSKTFDLKPGKYTFYCSVGNHRQAGMEGTLTVQ
jgi:plastocyanin